MDKRAVTILSAEKLGKIECHIHIHIFLHQLTEVECKDIHNRQASIWIGITKVRVIPSGFRFLLHHIIPCEYLVLFVLIKEVEWRTGELQHLRVILRESSQHVLSECGLRALVRLIHNHAIPFSREYAVVLTELAAYLIRTSEVLHRGKIDIMCFTKGTSILHGIEFCTIVFGTIHVLGGFKEEYLTEIFVPTFIHNRTVRYNNRALKLHAAHNL